MTTAILIKETFNLGWLYSFRELVHYCHGKKQVSMQADSVLEKELRVLHLDLQAAGGDCKPYCEVLGAR